MDMYVTVCGYVREYVFKSVRLHESIDRYTPKHMHTQIHIMFTNFHKYMCLRTRICISSKTKPASNFDEDFIVKITSKSILAV